MTSLTLIDINGKASGTLEASDKVFSRAPKESVVHLALTWLMASKRQGTASSKTRTEVRGGGKKPWSQKGTGRARSGSIRSPLWRGGGVSFGPKPRDFSHSLNKKTREAAIAMVISDKAISGKLKVVDKGLPDSGKTKDMAAFLNKLGATNSLMVFDAADEKAKRSAKNLKGYKLVPSKDINVLDVVAHEWLLLDKAAVESLEKRYGAK